MTPDDAQPFGFSVPSHASADTSDLVAALHKLRAILSAAQAQVTIALEEAAKVPAPPRAERARCPVCGVERPKAAMPSHLLNVHDRDPEGRELTRDRVKVAGVNGPTTLAAGDDA